MLSCVQHILPPSDAGIPFLWLVLLLLNLTRLSLAIFNGF